MYFININKLKEDIIENRFSQKDRFLYLFAWVILTEIFLVMPDFFPNWCIDITWLDRAVDIIEIFIVGIGTYLMYKFNKGANGKDFIDRYLAITWVIGIRAIIWFILIAIVMEILLLLLNTKIALSDEVVNYPFTFLYLLMMLYVYYRSIAVIKDIAYATK